MPLSTKRALGPTNTALDLDNNEKQIAPPAEDEIEPVIGVI
jgi:hypothetical protein